MPERLHGVRIAFGVESVDRGLRTEASRQLEVHPSSIVHVDWFKRSLGARL